MIKSIWILAGLVLLGGGMYLWLRKSPVAVKAHPFAVSGKVLSIAHRGGSGLAPENTLFAFERSRQIGVDVLEMDVQLTQDGQLVVIHDDSVDRTTNGSGLVQDYSLAELQELDAGYDWTDNDIDFPFRNKGIKVPSFEQVLVDFSHMLMVIELKGRDPAAAVALCNMLTAYNKMEKALVASFSMDLIESFRALCPSVATSTTTSEVYWFLGLHKLGLGSVFQSSAQALQIPPRFGSIELVNEQWMQWSRQHGMACHVWTINAPEMLQYFVALGVDGIITNYPDRLAAVLGQTTSKLTE